MNENLLNNSEPAQTPSGEVSESELQKMEILRLKAENDFYREAYGIEAEESDEDVDVAEIVKQQQELMK